MASKRVSGRAASGKSGGKSRARAGTETAEATGAKPRRGAQLPRDKAGTSEKQKAANRRNAQKSTGPRTPDGKRNSCFNAVTHGLTARTVLLPGEDSTELAARQQHLIDALKPRNETELEVVERMSADLWRSERAERGASKRIAAQLRHEPLERAAKELDEALELGDRLFWDLPMPLPISERSPTGKVTEPPKSRDGIHPRSPARLRLKLEQSVAGTEWLLDRWTGLMNRFYHDDFWVNSDAFKMVRLLGKHAIDMADDVEVLSVFLCTVALRTAPKPGPEREVFDWNGALIDMLTTFALENKKGVASKIAEHCEPFSRRLAQLPLARLAPADEEQASEHLNTIINRERCRLMEIRMQLLAIAKADADEAPARLAFETGTEGDRQRRYGLSAERLVIRRYSEFLKTRTMLINGTLDPGELSVISRPLSAVSSPLSVAAINQQPAGTHNPGAPEDEHREGGSDLAQPDRVSKPEPLMDQPEAHSNQRHANSGSEAESTLTLQVTAPTMGGPPRTDVPQTANGDHQRRADPFHSDPTPCSPKTPTTNAERDLEVDIFNMNVALMKAATSKCDTTYDVDHFFQNEPISSIPPGDAELQIDAEAICRELMRATERRSSPGHGP
jgi:hypothetical protein